MKQVKLTLIYFIYPYISTIFSFQHVVGIKNINERFTFPFLYLIFKVCYVSYTHNTAQFGLTTCHGLMSHMLLVAAELDCTD